MEQYLNFCVNKYVPGFEEAFPGFKVFISKGIRSDKGNTIGILYYCESEQVRDQYFTEGGTTMNDLGIAAWEKHQQLTDELEKLGTGDFEWSDWVIQ